MAEATSPRSTHLSVVDRVVDHNDDTRSLFLRLPDDPSFKWLPGQFISILIPLGDEVRRRAYSIASMSDSLLEICFNQVAGGRGVGWLFERAPGDAVEFMGPFGAFTLDAPPQVETIFIAEGTSIAPILPMLHRATASASHAPMFLLYAASDRPHILYSADLEALAARDPNFSIETLISENVYERLHAEVDRRWVAADSDRARQFYICGVGKDVSRIRDLLRGAGYERRAVHYEQW